MRLSIFKRCLLWATLLAPALSSLNNYNATAPPGLDPINNFCSRVDHQSVIKNGILYIDGGTEIFNFNSTNGQGTQVQGYNTFLIAVNMTTSWDWKVNISEILINKTANVKTGTYPPLVVRAGLYHGPPDDPNIYLYGGTTSYANKTFPGWMVPYPAQYTLWGFDTSTANTGWSQYDVSITVPQRPNAGAYAEAPDLGLGFYFNGELDKGSSQGMDLILGSMLEFLPGMVVLYFNNHTAQNFSTANVQYHDPRTRGQLQYVPAFGPKGILVSMAGSSKPSIQRDSGEIGNLVDMSSIDIFDVNSLYDGSGGTTWYTQQATGDIPSPRVDTCVVYATAPDNSSTNFYLYGGRNATGYYDDVYVLSLPSFTWVKIYEGLSPRYGMTCHFVGNRQMLTVGGLSEQPESCDWEAKSVAIYDLSSLTWGSVYIADDEPYTVPNIVYSAIGGDAEGKATVTTPSGGYSSLGLAHLFNSNFAVNATSNSTSTTPTSSPASTSSSAAPASSGSSTQSNTGAIVGGVVGGVGGIALIAGILFLLFHRRKRSTQVSELSTDQLTRLEKDRSQAVEKDARMARPDIDGELDHAMRASREPPPAPVELMGPETYAELNSPHSFAELGINRPYVETSNPYIYPGDDKNAI